jgi:exportin-2 (importin alpha re-exporter)
MKSDELFGPLKYVLENFAKTFLDVFAETAQKALNPTGGVPVPQLLQAFDALRLMARIFFSLNWQEIPEEFEDSMQGWTVVFAQVCLVTSYPFKSLTCVR